MNILQKFLFKILEFSGTYTNTYRVQTLYDFRGNAVRNKMWYRGNTYELKNFFGSISNDAGTSFWGTPDDNSSPIRRLHVDMPRMIVNSLTDIVIPDLNEITVKEENYEKIWEEIEKDNDFNKFLKKALKKTLIVGDGAVKIAFKESVSKYPLLEFYSGEDVEFIYDRSRLTEIKFYDYYDVKEKKYTLIEKYGRGYIEYELYNENQKQITLDSLDTTKNLTNLYFDNSVMLAIPFKIFESEQFEGRGESIYEGKQDLFDAFDETVSTWIDAIRAGRTKIYIPENLIPRSSQGGYLLQPNPFSNNFIRTGSDTSENAKNEIKVVQADIKTDALLTTYITLLGMILQGIISPSTLGIDNKKLDNAEAQREKEKTTLYTRKTIINALQDFLEALVKTSLNAYQLQNGKEVIKDLGVSVVFGEYASPSFEALCETLAKARPGKSLMSIEAQVEEMWGNDKDEEWKAEEVERLRSENLNGTEALEIDEMQKDEAEDEEIIV